MDPDHIRANRPGSYQLAIGPCTGSFKGQPRTRRYQIKLHGLLKPVGYQPDGKKLPELPSQECGEGRRWDSLARVATVFMNQRFSIRQKVTLSVENAGTFDDVITQQRAINLRVRSVRQGE